MLMSARELSDSLSWLVGGTSFLFRVVDRLETISCANRARCPGGLGRT
jgi:hypothetical protein